MKKPISPKKKKVTGWYFIPHDYGENGRKDLYGPFSSKKEILNSMECMAKLGAFPENIIFLKA